MIRYLFLFIAFSNLALSLEVKQANELIGKVLISFKKEIKTALDQNSFKLNVEKDWSDKSFNAYVNFDTDKRVVTITLKGGTLFLSKHEFVAVVCHELGHLLAGGLKNKKGSSSEGDSDYFMSSRCLKKIYNNGYLELIDADEKTLKRCSQNFTERSDIQVCANSISTSLSLASMMYDNETFDVLTYSSEQTNQTYFEYPESKCRVETFINGALNLAKPSCWFKE